MICIYKICTGAVAQLVCAFLTSVRPSFNPQHQNNKQQNFHKRLIRAWKDGSMVACNTMMWTSICGLEQATSLVWPLVLVTPVLWGQRQD